MTIQLTQEEENCLATCIDTTGVPATNDIVKGNETITVNAEAFKLIEFIREKNGNHNTNDKTDLRLMRHVLYKRDPQLYWDLQNLLEDEFIL